MAKIHRNIEQEQAFAFVCTALKELDLYTKILYEEEEQFFLVAKGTEKATVAINREAAVPVLREVMKNTKKELLSQAKRCNIDLEEADIQLLDTIK